ncbi:glycoside hydrolase family 3 N-terminal domain-containing protein [Ruminococcus sp.]|uniref:glycoside hydrolase family 3 protein n=1 Tax=Ruminococcus sp. TaxID=41978 RepID=UPI00260332B1|nr:glycoside hydrolase family 3 N-terminal domain-containing protein [Ruminococcus sp.]MDD6989804.1 glycoside hydrolase family 3 N-terminal domain-containing protein [Ruminococcus sp.]MDY6202806.1 glycoside hydrolase family 3 N-terminal domain-containing protein [Ruminococcus sp.]
MMKKLFSLITLFAVAILCVSCNFENSSSSENVINTTEHQNTTVQPTTISEEEKAERRIDKLISEMTIEEKVGQMFFVRYPDIDAAQQVTEYNLGGYILFGKDFDGKTREEITDNITSCQESAKIPLLIGVDEEGGTVVRVSSNENLRETPFLSPRDTFANGGWSAIEEDAAQKADLLLSLGINVNLAPVCDVTSDYSAFMYDRSFSGDADEVSRFVKKVVEISSEKKLGTVLKHFPGYGNNEDTHTGIAYDNRDFSAFTETDFKPFLEGINSGADCVLVSHNIVSCIDSEYPASLSKEVHNLLRNQLGFDGVIMTDDLSMGAITDYTGTENAAVLAIKNGNDLLCCSDVEEQYPAVLLSVQNGEIPVEQIDNSVKRILKWKQKLGLIE